MSDLEQELEYDTNTLMDPTTRDGGPTRKISEGKRIVKTRLAGREAVNDKDLNSSEPMVIRSPGKR